MKDMLSKIISVDRKAKESVDEAKREKENVEKRLYDKKKSLEEEYALKTQEKIDKMRKEKIEEFELSQKGVKEGYEEKKKQLEEIFDTSSDRWAEEIAQRAISI